MPPAIVPSLPRRPRTRHVAVAVIPLAALALAGCGSGRHNQQYLERSVVNGASATIEGLSIRSAYITRPTPKGGSAVVAFSLYADTRAAATELVSVSSQQLAGDVAGQLSTVKAGVSKVASAVPIAFQAGPGANIAAATFDDIATAALPATYFDVTFSFSNNLTQTLQVPVAQTGQVDPLSSAVPTSFPEEPFALRTSLPGEGVASSTP